MMDKFYKYTLYQNDEELGLVFSDDANRILELWSEFKSTQDGKDAPVWALKELGYKAGIYSEWEKHNAS